MTLPKFAMDYNSLPSAELWAFIKFRTGKPAPAYQPNEPHDQRPLDTRRRRAFYSNILLELDRNATFPFLRLPPELREWVYAELLTHDPNGRGAAFPQIMRCSKLVHQEAIKVLHDQSTFPIEAYFTREPIWWNPGHSRSTATISFPFTAKVKTLYLTGRSSRGDSERVLRRLPNYIRHVQIELRLDDHTRSQAQACSTPAKFLQAFVQAFPKIRSLRIVRANKDPNTITKENVTQTLLPLKQLPSKCVLELQGFDDQTEKMFWEELTEAKLKMEEDKKAKAAKQAAKEEKRGKGEKGGNAKGEES